MMPKSDPEARSTMSANTNDAATSVKLFIPRISGLVVWSTAFQAALHQFIPSA
jgi:hypothetical protein